MSVSERTGLLSGDNNDNRLGSQSIRKGTDNGSVLNIFGLGMSQPKQKIIELHSYNSHDRVAPSSALTPLSSSQGSQSTVVRAVPPVAPYCRKARHRSYYLKSFVKFRHWWKSSRLLVRLSGLQMYAQDQSNWLAMTSIDLLKSKGPKHALKIAKRMGQGGVMRPFLNDVTVFSRTLRIFVALWRWYEAAPCRRTEVGVEEFIAFVGNRVFRLLTRKLVDSFAAYVVIPLCIVMLENGMLNKDTFQLPSVLIVLGVLRMVGSYLASFQGSKFGRHLTRAAFHSFDDRWMPVMRINDVNLCSSDCNEGDEISPNAELVVLAKKVAVILGKAGSSPFTTAQFLQEAGFHQAGSGGGGYSVYHYKTGVFSSAPVYIHMTPYGPSLLDELPKYVVLERETGGAHTHQRSWYQYFFGDSLDHPEAIEGYCYKGAFFSPAQFACMKERYNEELSAYENACTIMCSAESQQQATPPTDLISLKGFLEMGKSEKMQRKHKLRLDELEDVVEHLSEEIKKKMSTKVGTNGDMKCKAPAGVIVYLEGLDCAGKSSSSGMVLQALQRAGYNVDVRRHNKPPTEAQKKQPWMARFEKPGTVQPEYSGQSVGGNCNHEHTAFVWDRGPAGDFVYGALTDAPSELKDERYKDFMQFDEQCFLEDILFCKLLFVTDRDSIARSLGKRLAQKKICLDLHKWLDASSEHEGGNIERSGLAEIDDHIDPTDFVAFNAYHANLHKFVTFAKNTDTIKSGEWSNPWLVVATTKRHPARLAILEMFSKQLRRFGNAFHGETSWRNSFLGSVLGFNEEKAFVTLKGGLSLHTLCLAMGVLCLLFVYMTGGNVSSWV